jgi:hypothetical protein
MGFRGVSVRQSGDRIVFRCSLKDSAGAKLASGTTALRLFEQQPDGSLKSFDWNDFTFKTTALTTDNRAMTHRTGNNGTYNTGIWTATLLSTEGTNTGLNGFTIGNIYLAQASNAGAVPTDQEREFQYGGTEGDTARMAKNVAFGNFEFPMVQSADHVTPATGLTVTAQRSIDGGAFAACANAPTEVGSGTYKIDLAASDLNGSAVTFRFAATGADTRLVTVITQL